MLRRLFTILSLFVTAFYAVAQIITVSHEHLVFEHEQPYIDVSISDADGPVNLEVCVYDDIKHLISTSSHQYRCSSGHADVRIPLNIADAPKGVFQYEVSVDETLVDSKFFVLNPAEVGSPTDAADDFDAFWDANLERLAAIPIDATLAPLPLMSSPRRKVYRVEMMSIDDGDGTPIAIHAYLATPVDGRRHPAILHLQGYDTHDLSAPLWIPHADSNPDWVELVLSTRGQCIDNRPPYENKYGEWVTFGITDEDTYYYRAAYLDVVRAIDFLLTCDSVDPDNIFAEGMSQGGALTFAAASLRPENIRAIAPSNQFLSDFRVYFATAPWPTSLIRDAQRDLGLTSDAMYHILSYFDVKNHAPRITAPAIVQLGLQDKSCPIRMKLASTNALASTDLTVDIQPELGHSNTPDWKSTYLAFFTDHSSAGVTPVIADDPSFEPIFYGIDGRRVSPDGLAAGIYIRVDRHGATKILIP